MLHKYVWQVNDDDDYHYRYYYYYYYLFSEIENSGEMSKFKREICTLDSGQLSEMTKRVTGKWHLYSKCFMNVTLWRMSQRRFPHQQGSRSERALWSFSTGGVLRF